MTEGRTGLAGQDTRRLQALYDLAREFSAVAGDLDSLLPLATRRLSEMFGDLCVIRLMSPDGQVLETGGAVHHPDPEFLALARTATAIRPQRVGEGLTGQVAATGQAVLIPVVDTERLLANLDPDRRAAVEQQRIASLVVAPLLLYGQVIGVVSLSRNDATRPFNEDDLRLLEDVAAHAALMIAHARACAAERASHVALMRSNETLRESEAAHRLLFEASPLPLFVFAVDTLLPIAVNGAALQLYGYEHDEFMQLKITHHAVAGHDTAKARLASWGDGEASGTSRYRRKDGTHFVAEYTTRALTIAGRRARITVIRDITERDEAERARALLAAIVQSSHDAVISKTLDGTITSWNAAAEKLFGYPSDEAIGKSIAIIIPSDRLDEERTLLDCVAVGDRVTQFETVRLQKGGTEVSVSISVSPILDASGKVIGASKTARDLTAQRTAKEALRRAEDQLRQAQKMEAIGRLAGGVAHDFNNLLCVILSYSQMIVADLPPNDPSREDINQIHEAAQRAADLTRQLLIFSRQQVVEPKVLDVNEIVAAMNKLLNRVLGEDIDLATVLSPRLGRIRADQSGVEQVIMNLVVNARDAMPTGGRLTIETENIRLDAAYAEEHHGTTPGPHVMLAVTDTGIGMDTATQARIFEPFFTTKEAGRGTGLGLSTVFGIAQQCGGSVWVYSEPGRGTTFKVYFPRVETVSDTAITTPPMEAHANVETILLVEDQAQVRAVALSILTRSGYQVLAADGASEAILLCDEHAGAIDLLLTDVVMPQMSGAELAKRLAARRPQMRVLYMSGYTDDSIVRHGVLESGLAFLQKPFTPDSLTRKVRLALSAPRTARP